MKNFFFEKSTAAKSRGTYSLWVFNVYDMDFEWYRK